MKTSFLFHFTVFCFFHSIHGLAERFREAIKPPVHGVTPQNITRLELKTEHYREFTDIFNINKYYTKPSLSKEVTKPINTDVTYENSDIVLTTIKKELREENFTVYFDSTLKNNTTENIKITMRKTRGIGITEKYQIVQSMTKSENINDSSESELDTSGEITDKNEFWVSPRGPTRRIFQSHMTHIRHFPFLVSVHVLGKFVCGGAIIKSDLVITASDCFKSWLKWKDNQVNKTNNTHNIRTNVTSVITTATEAISETSINDNETNKTTKYGNTTDGAASNKTAIAETTTTENIIPTTQPPKQGALAVRIGTNLYRSGGKIVNVVKVYIYPEKKQINTLAIMRLERHLNFTHPRVKKIAISKEPDVAMGNITIVGWGAKLLFNKVYNALWNRIQKAVFTVTCVFINAKIHFCYDCHSNVQIEPYFAPETWTFSMEEQSLLSQWGDMGDPAVLGDQLVGVVDWISYQPNDCGNPTWGFSGKMRATSTFKLGYYQHAAWIQQIMAVGEGLKELPRNISAPTEVVRSIIDQIFAENDLKLEEFTPIFYYFINLTIIEKQSRDEVSKLATPDFIQNDVNQKLYGSLTWQDAIYDALNEENITTYFNENRQEDVGEYIRNFASNPEGLKERYIQNLQNLEKYEDKDVLANETWTAEENGGLWNFSDTRRIFKGEKTKIKLFPFMASVQLFDRFACAGAIVSSDLVITAASCLQLAWNNRFFNENPSFLSVRVGSHFFTVGGEVISIQEVYFHPTYVPRTLKNNLALMRLRKHIHFRRKKRNVKKISIDRTASALPVNTPGITIIGWGAKTIANTITNAMSNKIHMAVLDFYDLESCREIYGKKFVTETNFCAGFITKGDGACNHDVGDPGVSRGVLLGITSFGSPVCGRADTPTVFTKLGYYADWIDEIMEQDVPHIKVRTTTRSLQLINRSIKLYGIDSDENKPISVREGRPQVNKSILEELGIPPITDDVLSEDLKGKIILREPHRTEEQKVAVKYPEESSEMDGSDNDKFDISTMSPVIQITGLTGYDPVNSMSRETEESETGNIDDIRTSKLSEIDYDKLDLSDTTALTQKPVTDIIDQEESVSSESQLNTGENFVEMISQLDSDFEHHETTGIIIEDDIDDEEDPTVLKEKERISSAVDDETNAHEEQKGEDKNSSNNQNMDEDDLSIRFGNIGMQHDDVLDKHHEASQSDDNVKVNEQSQDGVRNQWSEDILKREIENLIRELHVSNELREITEDLRNNNDSKPQDSLKNNTIDSSDTQLTLLYVPEDDKEVRKRAESYVRISDSEGLSIDPEPFEETVKSKPFNENVKSISFEENIKNNNSFMSDLIGEKEIYEIFADFMKSVSNKTFI